MIGIAGLGLKSTKSGTDRTECAESYLVWTPLQFFDIYHFSVGLFHGQY